MIPIKIYNPALEELATISAASSAIRKETINADNILNFSLRLRDPSADYINSINVVGLGTDYFDIAWYKKEQQADGTMMISVECEQVSYRLCSSDYAMSYFSMTDTPANILTALLADTDFTVGTVDFTDEITFTAELTGAVEGNQMSLRSVLMQFVNQLGGEVEFSGFSVSILTARGSAGPVVLTVGEDITVISEAIDKRTLDSLGNPLAVYTVGIYDGTDVNLGDVVQLTYSTMGINESLRIVSKSYDPYNPKRVSIEVGNYTKTIENAIYDLQVQKASAGYISNLQTAVNNLNEVITNSLGYYRTDVVDPATGATTTYTHDASTLETSVVIYVMTESGFAWTDQGWNGGSPVWQYGITSDGNAVLKVLTALGINANWIVAGMLQSADGSTYFDLDNAEIRGVKGDVIAEPIKGYMVEAGTLSTSTGAESSSTTYGRSKKYYPVMPGTEVAVSGTVYTCYKFFYDASKAFVSYSTSASPTAPSTAAYVRLRFYNAGTAFSGWSGSISGTLTSTVPVVFLINPTAGPQFKRGDDVAMEIKSGVPRFGKTVLLSKNEPTTLTELLQTIQFSGMIFDETVTPNSGAVPDACIYVVDYKTINSGAVPEPRMTIKAKRITFTADRNILSGNTEIETLTSTQRRSVYYTTGDLNDITEECAVAHPDVTNIPASGYWYVNTVFMVAGDNASNRNQIAYKYNGTDIYRRYYAGSWSAWSKIY